MGPASLAEQPLQRVAAFLERVLDLGGIGPRAVPAGAVPAGAFGEAPRDLLLELRAGDLDRLGRLDGDLGIERVARHLDRERQPTVLVAGVARELGEAGSSLDALGREA